MYKDLYTINLVVLLHINSRPSTINNIKNVSLVAALEKEKRP